MFYLIVINEIVGPVNLFVRLFCLLLLFSNRLLVAASAVKCTNGFFVSLPNIALVACTRPNCRQFPPGGRKERGSRKCEHPFKWKACHV